MFGEVIVSDSAGGTSGSTNAFLAVSWTQTGTFNNVTIEAALESGLPQPVHRDCVSFKQTRNWGNQRELARHVQRLDEQQYSRRADNSVHGTDIGAWDI